MPVNRGNDTNGPYYRWGNNGKKYYYVANNKQSRELARKKCLKQGAAIEISKNKK